MSNFFARFFRDKPGNASHETSPIRIFNVLRDQGASPQQREDLPSDRALSPEQEKARWDEQREIASRWTDANVVADQIWKLVIPSPDSLLTESLYNRLAAVADERYKTSVSFSDYVSQVENFRQALLHPKPGYNHEKATEGFERLNQEMLTKIVYWWTQVGTTRDNLSDKDFESQSYHRTKAIESLKKGLQRLDEKGIGKEAVAKTLVGMLTDTEIHKEIRKEIPLIIRDLNVKSVINQLRSILGARGDEDGLGQKIVFTLISLGGIEELRIFIPMFSDKDGKACSALSERIAEKIFYCRDKSMTNDLLSVIANHHKELSIEVTKWIIRAVASVLNELETDEKEETINKISTILSNHELHEDLKKMINEKCFSGVP